MFSMTDRIILVTGAGSGIGKTTARRLGELESVVIVVDQNGDNARETVQDLKQSNRGAVAIEADVSNPNVWPGYFQMWKRNTKDWVASSIALGSVPKGNT